MANESMQHFDEIMSLLEDCVETTAALTEEPATEASLVARGAWATRSTGPLADWAFETLGGAIPTEELRSALRVVLYWGMAAFLHDLLELLPKRVERVQELSAEKLRDSSLRSFSFPDCQLESGLAKETRESMGN